MIFVVQSLYFVVKYLVDIYRQQQRQLDSPAALCEATATTAESIEPQVTKVECDEAARELIFDPPLFIQRYAEVQQALLNTRWTADLQKVVEFGCAQMKMFKYFKHIHQINDVMLVDIDEDTLMGSSYTIMPLSYDYLMKRPQPLTVHLLVGSIAHPDRRVRGADAVIAIEVVEHLYPDTLDALPYNIFGFIRPKIVVITTPNADFNVLFPNFKGFRHPDHKFEWTKSQFYDWANNIVTRFPQYTVQFSGCGEGPIATHGEIGFCSQIATFELKDVGDVGALFTDESFGVCTYHSLSKVVEDRLSCQPQHDTATCSSSPDVVDHYKIVKDIEYPFHLDERSPEEIKLSEAKYQIDMFRRYKGKYFNNDLNRMEIPIREVIHSCTLGYFSSVPEMRDLLSAANYEIAECTVDGIEDTPVVVQQLTADGMSDEWGAAATTTTTTATPTPIASDCDDAEAGAASCRNHYISDPEEDWDPEPRTPDKKLTTTLKLNAIVSPMNGTCISENRFAFVTDASPGKMQILQQQTAPSPGQQSDQLIDSGYQKSISAAEWSPQSPLDGMFEEQFHNYSTGSDKKAITPVEPLPSTSANRKTRRDAQLQKRTGGQKLEEDDIRDVAICLVQNMMNRMDDDDIGVVDVVKPQVVQPPLGIIADAQNAIIAPPAIVNLLPAGQPVIVENGDLANNNRDLEGNNYPDLALPPFENNEIDDNLNENIEVNLHHVRQDLQEPAAVQQPNLMEHQDAANMNHANHEEAIYPVVDLDIVGPPNLDDLDIGDDELDAINLQRASQEALVDSSSEPNLVDDSQSVIELNDVMAGLDLLRENVQGNVVVEAVVEYDQNGVALVADHDFPNWLLNMFPQDEDQGAEDDEDADDNDEAHFYCQGDGVGVHPSVAEVDLDDEQSTTSDSGASAVDDADNEASTSSAATLATLEIANEHSHSADTLNNIELIGNALAATYEQQSTTEMHEEVESVDEFYDATEGDEDLEGGADHSVND